MGERGQGNAGRTARTGAGGRRAKPDGGGRDRRADKERALTASTTTWHAKHKDYDDATQEGPETSTRAGVGQMDMIQLRGWAWAEERRAGQRRRARQGEGQNLMRAKGTRGRTCKGKQERHAKARNHDQSTQLTVWAGSSSSSRFQGQVCNDDAVCKLEYKEIAVKYKMNMMEAARGEWRDMYTYN